MKTARLCVAAAACVVVLSAVAAQAQEGAAGAGGAAYFGEGFVLVATVRDPDKRVWEMKKFIEAGQFLERSWAKGALSTPQAMQGKVALAGLAATAGTDPWTAVGAALGRDLVVGLRPGTDPKKPRLLAVSISRDKPTVDKLLMSVETLAGLIKMGKPDPEKTTEVRGETVFRLNEELAFCRAGEAVIVASDAGMIEEALKVRADEAGEGADKGKWLAANKDYGAAAARAAEGGEAMVAWVWADLRNIETVKQLPAVSQDPLGGFLFGGWLQMVRMSERAAAYVKAEGNDLVVDLAVEAKRPLPRTHAGFIGQPIGSAATTSWRLNEAEIIGEAFIVRDWAKLFSEREALLALPAAGKVVAFSNQLTALLGQLDFMGDVLPAVESPLRFIAARQDFSDLPYLPTPRLPAFALVAPLKPGKTDRSGAIDLERRLYSGSQTALSLINLDAANKNEPSMLIDTDRYRDQRMIFTEFPAAPSKVRGGGVGEIENGMRKREVVGQRHNFAPAIAIVKNQYIIATSTALLKSIIDAILEKQPAALGAEGSRSVADIVTVSGDGLAAVLDDNREEYIASEMLKKNIPRSQAEGELEVLRALVGLVEGVRIIDEQVTNGYRATVRVRLHPAEPEVMPVK